MHSNGERTRLFRLSLTIASTLVIGWATAAIGQEKFRQLNASEVEQVVLGKLCRAYKNEFRFERDGTYTAKTKNNFYGPWTYKLAADGTITGRYASYRFHYQHNRLYMKHFRSLPSVLQCS